MYRALSALGARTAVQRASAAARALQRLSTPRPSAARRCTRIAQSRAFARSSRSTVDTVEVETLTQPQRSPVTDAIVTSHSPVPQVADDGLILDEDRSDVECVKDVLLQLLKGVAQFGAVLHSEDELLPRFSNLAVTDALATLNVNTHYDIRNISYQVQTVLYHRQWVIAQFWDRVELAAYKIPSGAAQYLPSGVDVAELINSSELVNLVARAQEMDSTRLSLIELFTDCFIGSSQAYVRARSLIQLLFNANVLLDEQQSIDRIMYNALGYSTESTLNLSRLLRFVLDSGAACAETLRLLDRIQADAYEPMQATTVRTTPVAGAALLVSGSDLHCLETILRSCEEDGINVYTHGDLLAAHAYPRLSALRSLVGHYGGRWQRQVEDFAAFPGPVVVTNENLLPPSKAYMSRFYTTGQAYHPDGFHMGHFGVVNSTEMRTKARAMAGFAATEEPAMYTRVGYGYSTLRDSIDHLIEALRPGGGVDHVLVLIGSDCGENDVDYLARMSKLAPKSTLMFTLGCTGYFDDSLTSEQLAGLPRLMNVGQVTSLVSLLRALEVIAERGEWYDVNELPVSFVIPGARQVSTSLLLLLLSRNVRSVYTCRGNGPRSMSTGVFELMRTLYGLQQCTHDAAHDLEQVLSRGRDRSSDLSVSPSAEPTDEQREPAALRAPQGAPA